MAQSPDRPWPKHPTASTVSKGFQDDSARPQNQGFHGNWRVAPINEPVCQEYQHGLF